MPSKYTIRNFVEGGVYHVYNKTAGGKILFQDDTDYETFHFYLYIYLKPIKAVLESYANLPFRLQIKNLHKEVDCLAYCLMPDHFHLLLKQTSANGVTKLMKQVTHAYTEYYNKKYHTTGPLMQGRYKAVAIEKDQHLLQIARFIHLNPIIAQLSEKAGEYTWSSMKEYENSSLDTICNKRLILSYYSSEKVLSQFVNNKEDYSRHIVKIKSSTID
ncbi:MAG TPA: transposase [Candidatus Levybacteria bacterium]|nr:transposase [Candidatus Levybacteria bacterium]